MHTPFYEILRKPVNYDAPYNGENSIHIQNPGNSDISDFSDIFSDDSDNSNTSDISGTFDVSDDSHNSDDSEISELPEVSENSKYRNCWNYRKIGFAGIIGKIIGIIRFCQNFQNSR